MEDEEFLKKLTYYIEIGAIREAGIDENGEIVYEIDEENTKRLAPELWESHLEYVDRVLLDLYKDGLVDVEYDENLNATMLFTEKGFEIAKEKGAIPLEEI